MKTTTHRARAGHPPIKRWAATRSGVDAAHLVIALPGYTVPEVSPAQARAVDAYENAANPNYEGHEPTARRIMDAALELIGTGSAAVSPVSLEA